MAAPPRPPPAIPPLGHEGQGRGWVPRCPSGLVRAPVAGGCRGAAPGPALRGSSWLDWDRVLCAAVGRGGPRARGAAGPGGRLAAVRWTTPLGLQQPFLPGAATARVTRAQGCGGCPGRPGPDAARYGWSGPLQAPEAGCALCPPPDRLPLRKGGGPPAPGWRVP